MINVENIVIAMGAAFVTALFGYFAVNRKTMSEETGLALSAWKEVSDSLKRELEATRQEVTLLRQELRDTEERYQRQIHELQERILFLK